MIRQCAWCLRLISNAGERISQQPVPKLYEASHGMCSGCGALWMEQVLGSMESSLNGFPPENSSVTVQIEADQVSLLQDEKSEISSK